MSIKGMPDEVKAVSKDAQWKLLEEYIKDWEPMFTILKAMRGHDLYVFQPLASTRPPLNWRSKAQKADNPTISHPRVWFLGYSMHAMLPNRGMGGNKAMLGASYVLLLLNNSTRLPRNQAKSPLIRLPRPAGSLRTK
ncbi:hypothetical protein BDV12DRAFT_197473 [Aspergillus spectabilis]